MDILDRVKKFLKSRNAAAYFVGGFVRDQLLGRTDARDIDLAIDGDAVALARAFANATGGAFYLMDAEHAVARVILGDTYVDFAQLRGDLQTDLATRDFTINAMALPAASRQPSLVSELIDPFRGYADLQARRMRAVSDSAFEKDPVRLLRAVRLSGELDFTIDPQTQVLIRRDATRLANASMERARDELCKILALPNTSAWLRRADELGLLDALLPTVTALKTVVQSAPHVYDAFEHTLRVLDELEKIQADGYTEIANGEFVSELQAHFAQTVSTDHTRGTLLRLAALLHDIGKAVTRSIDAAGVIHFYEHDARGAEMSQEILRRLRFSNDEIETVTTIVAQHLRPPLMSNEPRVTNRGVYRFFRDTSAAGVDVCVLAFADRRGTYAPQTKNVPELPLRATLARLLERYLRAKDEVIAPPALIDGHILMRELKVDSGPRVGRLLEAIREAQVEGEVKSREDALALARKILSTENRGEGV